MTPEYIYLHGFASSPQSGKAQYLRDRFDIKAKIKLNILDLNQGDFTNLSLTRQIRQTVAAFPSQELPIILIGSSFGGLTATWVANKCPQVTSLILLAPAFGFLANWRSRLEETLTSKCKMYLLSWGRNGGVASKINYLLFCSSFFLTERV